MITRLPLLLLCLASSWLIAVEPVAAADALTKDLWYVGKLNDQPAVTMHVVVKRRPDGGAEAQQDMTMVISRSLGASSIRMEVRESQLFVEDTKGTIASFRFDHEESSTATGMPESRSITTATGKVEGKEVVATVNRLGRSEEVKLKIPDDVVLLGQQRSQDLLVGKTYAPGDKESFGSLALLSGTVVVARCTAVFGEKLANGNSLFDMSLDVMPIPMRTAITPAGDLASMTMNLGFINLDLRPSPGPVPLLGAELAPTGLVTAKGPAPKAGARNRYRLPAAALAVLPEDPFSSSAGDVLTVTADDQPSPLADPAPFLKAEPQLELDDPALRAWVLAIKAKHEQTAELAEQLRLAVRAHIVHKDLSKGDASALEAFRDQRGDCTEHANLLCASLRIAGIPARTEVGLVYAADFGGWVGHAWNCAWIDGRWVHLDSAYPGVSRSMYLKLGSTTGKDPLNTGAALVTALSKLIGGEIETLADP